MIKRIFCVVALSALAGCATQRVTTPGETGLVAEGTPVTGRLHGYIAARRHGDFILVAGKEQRREIEYGWDYDHAIGLRRTFDLDGKLLETKELVGADLPLTSREVERARELVRADPQLAGIVNLPDVIIWSGGFAFRKPGDPSCSRGSRCIHVIAASNHGNTAVAHAIVDLQGDRVVYPFYKPADGEPFGAFHGE